MWRHETGSKTAPSWENARSIRVGGIGGLNRGRALHSPL